MNIRRKFTIFLFFLIGFSISVADISARETPYIYWTDSQTVKIQRANLDGSHVQDLLTSAQGLGDPHGLALDVVGGKMYWADWNTAKIQRANLNGSNVQDLLTEVYATAIALDVVGGKMYWTDTNTDKIHRANLDGSNIQDLVTQGLAAPKGISLDIVGGKMYWADGSTRKIQRANLDGSNIQDLVTRSQGLIIPGSLALDVGSGKMYWTDWQTDKIQRANLDGSNIQDLVTFTRGLANPGGIALDVAGGKMYWTDNQTDKIQRANLDGSNVQDLVTQGLANPRDIAISVQAISPTINIPDVNLRAKIEEALGKASGATITTADMTSLTRLDAPNANISNLTGLEHATNLTWLELGVEYVSGQGWINSNSISDISAVSGLTNLTYLGLTRNKIVNISAVSRLINLTELALGGNTISDISAVSRLTNLRALWLWDNSISGISAVSGLTNLTHLGLGNNNISDISSLSRLINLTWLGLGGNNISNISSLSGLTNLTNLYLWGNNISNISSLSGLANLTDLYLWGNNISNISSLSGLANLTDLYLSDNSISDISALASNRGLGSGDTVDVRGNPLNAASINTHIPTLQRRGVEVTFDAPQSDLVVQSPSVSKSALSPGESFTLSATVRNSGSGGAAATTLRYYRSTDSTISRSDTQVGTDAVGSLSANSNSPESITLNAPNASGTYYYGACVDAVSNEADTANNCSTAVTVTVQSIEPVNIPDPNLRAAIERTLGKASGATITTADMATLTQLDAQNANISNLTGLEHVTNLQILLLNDNNISNLSPLAGLSTLEILRLNGNNLSDVSPLAHLTKLRELRLYYNRISNVSPLAGLTNLEVLALSGNRISDVSPLTRLTNVEYLWLENNRISDVSPLTRLTKLRDLSVKDNRISDLSPLVLNTGLETDDKVDVRGNPLNAVSINTHIPKLQDRGVEVLFDVVPVRPTTVTVSANPNTLDTLESGSVTISVDRDGPVIDETVTLSLSPPVGTVSAVTNNGDGTYSATYTSGGTAGNVTLIATATGVGVSGSTTITIVDTWVNIPDPGLRAAIERTLGKASGATITTADMATLTRLDAPDANIRNLTGLEYATNLTWLDLDGNTISDISALSDLINLTTLWLAGNNIVDISSLSGLTNLTRLDLWHNSISDISTLSGLTNLTGLGLADTSISDISALSGLTNLTDLHLSDNSISDISTLSGLTNLEWLVLGGNSISDISALVSNRGLGSGDEVDVRNNPLSTTSINTHIPTLQRRGVNVLFDAPQSDLVVQSPSVSKSPLSPGESFTLSATVRNSGSGGTTAGTTLRYYRSTDRAISRSDTQVGTDAVGSLNANSNSPESITLNAPTTAGTYYYGACVDAVSNEGDTANNCSTAVTVTVQSLEPVNIPDPNLRAKIEEALGKASGAAITPADMATLTRLDAYNANISNLTGLEHATNLTRLDLGGESVSGQGYVNSNSVSDLSPLLDLTSLTDLNLHSNNISNISAVSGLTNLTTLSLSSNPISNISAVSGLTSLTQLYLFSNPISDISAVSSLTNLTRLQLAYNNISNISAVSGLTNLTWLSIYGNPISDVSALSGLTNLTDLHLSDNSISDISTLSGLTNLKWLALGGNKISDLSPLVSNTGLGSGDTVNVIGNPLNAAAFNTHIPTLQGRGVEVRFDPPRPVNIPDANLRAAIERALGKGSGAAITTADMAALTRLDAANANINNLTGLEHATNLTELHLTDNSISDISAVSGLINLTRLWLGSNSIFDISVLSGLTNLTNLYLGGNNIFDISVLSGLTNLTVVNLASNRISDISAVSRLTNLTWLSLVGNSILNISPVSGLINLTELYLRDNSISDISSVSGLTNLTDLLLNNNNISDISVLTGLTNLTRLWLHGNNISDLSPLVSNRGLASRDTVDVRGNPLNAASITTHIPTLQRRGVEVQFDPPRPVNIPDPNLRAKIEEALGKASGAAITTADMAGLTRLEAQNANISNLIGLEGATNLTTLFLNNNSISDISSVSGLSKLTFLHLRNNSIPDISAISGLTELTNLYLDSNNMTSISAVSGLTKLKYLSLGENSISNISVVSGLTELTYLSLEGNNILDISALVSNTGLGTDDIVNVKGNPLNAVSINTHIPDLQRRGVEVLFDAPQFDLVVQSPSVSKSPLSPGESFTLSATVRNSGSGGATAGTTLRYYRSTDRAISRSDTQVGTDAVGSLNANSNSPESITLNAPTTSGTYYYGACVDAVSNEGDTANNCSTAVTVTVQSLERVNIPDPNLRAAIERTLGKASGAAITTADMGTLTRLDAQNANISNLTGLEHATNLTELSLDDNNISNISPLVSNGGLGRGDKVNVRGNPLNTASRNTHIPTLQRRGVEVLFDPVASPLKGDINRDGVVNIQDLVLAARRLGQRGQNDADMNGDGVVNIQDLVLVARAFGNPGAAPALHPQDLAPLTAADVQRWLTEAEQLGLTTADHRRGIAVLEQLLSVLTPKETTLLPNYPNPFNPETWIPYHLANAADVTLTIYDISGVMVRQLELGYQPAGYYTNRSKAAYWDGRNEVGETIASGVYFYHLSAGNYSATRRMLILK